MNQLTNAFKKFGFSDSEIFEISAHFHLKQYKSHDHFLQHGQTCEYLGFISKGIFQFYVDGESNETTTYVAFKNDFIISVQSYFAGKPSKESIKALTDSEVWVIRKTDFEKLHKKINSFKDFYIKVLEKLVVCIDESRFDYITLKPEERYMKLMKENPELLHDVPLKYLSTLIGITPRHLSRIRNNIR